ncbi:MAG: chorismate mutase [Planctomycetes bacterium]|nr:chorismate mutase [Planctomycetota bacterium]
MPENSDPLPLAEGDAARLQAWRAELDRLNLRLVALVQERARLVEEVARFKRARALPPFDPQREQEMLEQLLLQAGPGLAPDELARLLRIAMRFYRRVARGARG